MFDALSPGERLRKTFEMYDFARHLARAGILREQPNATEVEIQQQLFLRWYGDDFTEPQKDHILSMIAERFAAPEPRSPLRLPDS